MLRLPPKPRVMRKAPDYDVERDGVTQSLLATWVNCRQHAAYELDGWESPGSKEALVFGSLWHWLLEQAYAVLTTRMDRLGKMHPTEVGSAAYFGFAASRWMKGHAGAVGDAELCERMLTWAEGLWEGYWRQWAGDLELDFVGVESKFDVQWHGWRLRGMRDGLFRDGKGRLTLLETKTASRVDDDSLLLMLPVNFQVLYYLTACEAEGQTARRVLYNVVRKPQIKQGSQSLADYTDRIQQDVAARPDFYFHRYESVYTKRQIAAFQVELAHKLHAFEDWHTHRAGHPCKRPQCARTYRNEAACVSRWRCPFLPACSAGGDMTGYIRTRRLFRELED